MQHQFEDLSDCPSFNRYSSSAQLAEGIAARVRVEESLAALSHDFAAGEDCEVTEEDFEFVSLPANPDLELFIDGGRIPPVSPVFNRDLLLDHLRDAAEEEDKSEESICISLQNLFLHNEHDPPSSSSSSEADELESVTPGTYCVWTPKMVEPSPGRCEKSNSTGSSSTARQPRQWRLRDLLKRSNSEGGKNSALVFLTPAPPSSKSAKKGRNSKGKKVPTEPAGKKEKAAAGGENKVVSAHEKFYVRNRKMMEEDRRRTYLPYRQGLVGLFANVNGLGRNFPPS